VFAKSQFIHNNNHVQVWHSRFFNTYIVFGESWYWKNKDFYTSWINHFNNDATY